MKRFSALILGVALIGGSPPAYADTQKVQEQSTGDTLTQGLWWLYQLQYDKARELFGEYTKEHPKDPAGYFYKTATDWWQLAQEFDKDLPEIVTRFEDDYQATIRVANALSTSSEKDKAKARAFLYAGGAHGLKGRWMVTQGQWVKAYFLGKNGHKLLKRALFYDRELYDAYLGLGIYDYYTDTLPGIQKVLANLLIHGDRKRGLEELHLAIQKGEHAPVEAKMFLIEIYTYEEHMPAKALPIAQELHRQFPKSPAMYLAEIIDFYELKQWDQVIQEARIFMDQSQKEVPYFQHRGIYPALYCIGVASLYGKHDLDTCFNNMAQIIKEVGEDSPSRWVTFALLRTGQVYDARGKRDQAVEYYRKVLARPNFWGSYREAKAYLNTPYSN